VSWENTVTNRQGQYRSAPALRLLIMLVKIGFGAAFWALLILTVIAWPLQSVLAYAALIAVAGIAAAIKAWQCHRPSRRADRARWLRVVITMPCTATPNDSINLKDGDA
jgi:hypothetical protein